ncbi:hypothetical protein ABEB36_015077 [Hypothenemus hampei]|uniref:MADF domain-containing protein n=1 Tax=Hypothenemus hampei TaxID=57062 RepID=A0ABD1E330_HYPHA
MWSHKQIECLIQLYKVNPCLYVPKHSLYKNKNARNKALDEIRTELFKLGLAASIAEIKAKFNNLRTNFLAQHRKYLKSLKSGAGSDDDMSTASTSRNSTHYESNGDKKKKIKNKDEGFIIKKAANVLTNLTNVLEKKSNPKPVETPTPNKTDIKIFVEFIESQLEYLKSNEEILLETQQEIVGVIWAARKKNLH